MTDVPTHAGLRSMTGFGEGTAEVGTARVTASIRSVNHKQLDVRVVVPSGMSALEVALTDSLRARLARGRVEARLHVTPTGAAGGAGASLDALEPVVANLRAAKRHFGLAGELSVGDLVRAVPPGFFSTAAEAAADDVTAAATAAMRQALDALVAFREREGQAVTRFFGHSLDELDEHLGAVRTLAASAVDEYRHALAARVRELLAEARPAPSNERIEQEVVLVAERSDIAEEIQRAEAHTAAMRAAITDTAAAVGKQLDFLLQELIRETNTMASKSVSAELTHRVVAAKACIERMREQAQNVE